MILDSNIHYEFSDEALVALVNGKLSCQKSETVPGGFNIQYDSIKFHPDLGEIEFLWEDTVVTRLKVPLYEPGTTYCIERIQGRIPLKFIAGT